ncbi:phosphopantetheine-binding protein [Aquipseudomonas alcaligenes]|uniref:phosphopantetheine-binding protein n=1 Tax=Aquipseudomonas alcaligenes TaxID=43263 RepID=UPI0009ED1D1E|nr:phosphopantetheine-binding protein [Pseudomonas alcaligenes]
MSPRKAIGLVISLLITCPVYSAQNSCSTAGDAVMGAISSILGIPEKEISIKSPFSEQAKAGDALDVIEIIMTIEENLNVEIPDHSIDQKTGSTDITDLPNKLTVEMLQEIAISACSNA